MDMDLSDADFAALLGFRTDLRRFLHWSEQQAEKVGLLPAQHQLLLAVRGHADDRGPTIGDVAGYLLLRHHSAVGLVDRAEAARLVRRRRDPEDHRVVRVNLTARGADKIRRLSSAHLEELDRLSHRIGRLWRGLSPDAIP